MPQIQCIPDANVRAQSYMVARTSMRCWHCGLSTRLLALVVPPNHEILDDQPAADDGRESAPDEWQRASFNAVLFYVEELPDGVENRLRQLLPSFRLAHSAATQSSYWANHCEQCGALLGDHELHCEPEGAFIPSNEAAATIIELVEVAEPFTAVAAGCATEPEFLACMRRA